jgi:rhodanese-related sulfurtransferase
MKRVLTVLVLVALPLAVWSGGRSEAPSAAGYEDPERLAELVRGEGTPYVLVDVRTPEEFATGHLPTAVNIPHTEIGARPPTTDKGALIVVYCRSGNRSTTAAGVLEGLGYTNVVNFGAIGRWRGELVTE